MILSKAPTAKTWPEGAIRRVLEEDCFRELFYRSGQRVQLQGLVWWLEDDATGRIVSVANIAHDEQKRPVLWNVCTATKYQKQGYAERLLRAVLEIWKEHTARAQHPYLYLYVKRNALHAQRLYQKLGFRLLSSYSSPDDLQMVYTYT